MKEHSFVVPTYGRSPHLEACLASLAAQRVRSEVVVCTSTPFPELPSLCETFRARLVVHGPNAGIGRDWNAALAASESALVTIAHQDDLYGSGFVEETLETHRRWPDSVLYFCDAEEITEAGQPRAGGRNSALKRLMVAAAYGGGETIRSAIARRALLGFGNPIVCPTVTINRRVAADFRFREELRTNMDWLAWLDLSGMGPVTRIRRPLVSHRVHTDSETARCLDDGARWAEDQMVFRQLWPTPFANLLARVYSYSYGGYL
ncbi:glycosyltransferase family 2 protein [Cognatilysobacter tabacisoli]|uniref:glycosyltransferase family 2 protein n=1 Tax=Cognatilysobacter tabacisoli TaxID=2315424 RepID=UPI0013007C8B|nr:glycosyltransferase family 2 protein [Lysobacter tabacisoli]